MADQPTPKRRVTMAKKKVARLPHFERRTQRIPVERPPWSDGEVVKTTMTVLMYAMKRTDPGLARWYGAWEAFVRDHGSAKAQKARTRLKRETDALGFFRVA
jgi:hypothetical protein